jgi:hypothetical protein
VAEGVLEQFFEVQSSTFEYEYSPVQSSTVEYSRVQSSTLKYTAVQAVNKL